MWWALAVVIAALMAWVAWYERENRREFQFMMEEHNEQLRAQLQREREREISETNRHHEPLKHDFVHLESRVDELAKDVRELRNAVERWYNANREPTDERPYDHL